MIDYISPELLEEWDDIFEHRKAANYQDPYWEHQEEIMQTKIHYELYKASSSEPRMSFDMWRKFEAKHHRKNVTEKMRRKVMERDNYTCRICGKYMPDGKGIHIDHITPLSKYGKTRLSNLQTLCVECNRKKGKKLAVPIYDSSCKQWKMHSQN